jgi:TRAP-type C4-dicarboxylate transport system permease small subunit
MDQDRTVLQRLTGWIALVGGLTMLAAAGLVATSVIGRWLFNSPVSGDFEMVKMATAVAVFAFLPYTQARRGNIVVDTFTGWLPERGQGVLDSFWDLVYAAVIAGITYALVYGTLDSMRSGETTMVRQIALWPTIALSTALAGLLALTSVLTAVERLRVARP